MVFLILAILIGIIYVAYHINKNSDPPPDDEKDNWEGSFWEVQDPLPVKASLHINYQDGAGKQSERTVDVSKFGVATYGDIIIGRCRMRNATRTFRTDRIKRCIDEETGEIISDVSKFLREKYENSPERALDKLADEEYDTIRVLLYVGKADGRLMAPEKKIIRETCKSLTKDSRVTDEMIDEMLSSLEPPTTHAFKLAVGRIDKAESTSRNILMKAAEDMVATQKTAHQAEKEALEYMRKRFFGGNSTQPTA